MYGSVDGRSGLIIRNMPEGALEACIPALIFDARWRTCMDNDLSFDDVRSEWVDPRRNRNVADVNPAADVCWRTLDDGWSMYDAEDAEGHGIMIIAADADAEGYDSHLPVIRGLCRHAEGMDGCRTVEWSDVGRGSRILDGAALLPR